MARRSGRLWTERDTDLLLLDAARFRAACVAACTRAPIGSPAYAAAGAAMEAIDRLAEALTGDKRLFHGKPHGH